MIIRAIIIWILLAVVAIANGVAREKWVAPRAGELATHWVGTASALVLFFAVMLATIGWIGPETGADPWRIGALWFVMTVAFEFGFGHYVAGHPWRRLFADYNLLAGRVWILVLILTLAGPYLAERFRALAG